ncbi:synaptobrevin [Anaeramoeba flamelloides]|uniref:Synaptobrevin n=1 Tax=Anaeramoeba flamelloides TaxID=1746091 RepID=A0AAV7ZMR6_9EUKA|nr:synaptobrevin [Anaeramoeba flamelloides]KAJ6232477.1 synaptobrevin [Anaeramoeba flamelloides]
MKILSLCLYQWRGNNITEPKLLASAFELSSFGFFKRKAVQEWCVFISDTLVKRTNESQRQSVKENNYLCHVHNRFDNLACVAVCDSEYTPRVAFALLNKVMDDFNEIYENKLGKLEEYPFEQIGQLLTKFQDPNQVDKLSKIQRTLDETTIVLQDTIEKVLERGEKLENLVDRSEVLSMQSKQFYKTAKKHNSCCIIC